MKRIIRINESQLREVMGKSFKYLCESEFNTPFDCDGDEDSCLDNPANSNNAPQIGVTPVIQNDTQDTEIGVPPTGDDFARSQAPDTPIRNAYSPARGIR